MNEPERRLKYKRRRNTMLESSSSNSYSINSFFSSNRKLNSNN